MKVSVIGLGKLGSCYAAFYADRGFSVLGTDADQSKVEALAAGRAPVAEPELQKLIDRNRSRLTAVGSIEEAVLGSDASFLIVPTPSEKDGSFSVKYVERACADIGAALRKKKEYHLVSLVSTVLPGDCRSRIIPALEKASKRTCGPDFGYCYNPSLIALGDIIHNLTHPDFLFLGAFDKKSGDSLARIYAKLYPGRAPERMSIESVELAKIALNSYVTMKITFANTLGMIARQIPFADADAVTTALGKDKRVGSAYFRSGLGYGGPCFPRDNYAFAHMAKRHGVEAPLALATHRVNARIPLITADRIEEIAMSHRAKAVGFLGVSYKPKTAITDESQALAIAKAMRRKGYAIGVYEPLGSEEAAKALGKSACYPETLEKLVAESDLIFVSNKDAVFEELPKLIRKAKSAKVIVDPWGMFESSSFGPVATYVALGRSGDGRKHR